MRYKVRAILKKKAGKTVTFTVFVSITVNGGTPSLISIVDKFSPKYWSEKQEAIINHPMAESLNTKILHTKTEVSNLILKQIHNKKNFSAASIKTDYLAKDLSNIFDFATSYVSEMRTKRDVATLINIEKHMRKLAAFHGSQNLNFQDITPTYLTNYEKWLFIQGHKNNYVQVVIRTIRRMFTVAKKRGLVNFYPFEVYEMVSYKAPDKKYPTAKELQKIKEFETDDKLLQLTKAWFVFACHSGLRISDWHRFNATPDEFIQNDRLKLHPKKKSVGFISMPIYGDLKQAIKEVRLHPFDIEEQTFNDKIKVIAEKLGIKKPFSAHSARHHFAIVQCLEKGISSETGAELMGITLETFVNNYSVVTEEKIDLETERAWK